MEENGLTLWDCRFEKEGGAWYLRYFVDKEGDISMIIPLCAISKIEKMEHVYTVEGIRYTMHEYKIDLYSGEDWTFTHTNQSEMV